MTKEEKLYDLIHTEIMDARVKINMILKDNVIRYTVDDIMANLIYSTPKKVIKLFNEKTYKMKVKECGYHNSDSCDCMGKYCQYGK